MMSLSLSLPLWVFFASILAHDCASSNTSRPDRSERLNIDIFVGFLVAFFFLIELPVEIELFDVSRFDKLSVVTFVILLLFLIFLEELELEHE